MKSIITLDMDASFEFCIPPLTWMLPSNFAFLTARGPGRTMRKGLVLGARPSAWPDGKIDGPGKWKKPLLNQCHLSIFHQHLYSWYGSKKLCFLQTPGKNEQNQQTKKKKNMPRTRSQTNLKRTPAYGQTV